MKYYVTKSKTHFSTSFSKTSIMGVYMTVATKEGQKEYLAAKIGEGCDLVLKH
jgi:hypothetical protein